MQRYFTLPLINLEKITSIIIISQAAFIIQCYFEISYYIISLMIINILFYISLISKNLILRKEFLINTITIAFLSSYLTLIYGKPGSTLTYLLLLIIPLYFTGKLTYLYFDKFFIYINSIALVFFMLSFLGFIDYIIIEIGGRLYKLYGLTISDHVLEYNINNLQALRFYGIVDEPGRLGVFLAFSLIAAEFKINVKNFLALTMGILTFSTIFFLLIFIYFLIRKKRLNYILYSSIGLLLLLLLLDYFNENLSYFVIYKLNFLSFDTLSGRFNNLVLNENFWNLNLKEIIIGSKSYINDPSFLLVFFNLGLVGILFYILILLKFRNILIYLIPLIFVRYNFIFTDILFIYAFSCYIKAKKNCSCDDLALTR